TRGRGARPGGRRGDPKSGGQGPGRAPSAIPPFALPQIYALNRVMTELEQQQFDSFCKQMQGGGE
ncbi:SVBP protein, partial [Serilophus lunatus]|nr:SVBP protein [Serilophus lunatus]